MISSRKTGQSERTRLKEPLKKHPPRLSPGAITRALAAGSAFQGGGSVTARGRAPKQPTEVPPPISGGGGGSEGRFRVWKFVGFCTCVSPRGSWITSTLGGVIRSGLPSGLRMKAVSILRSPGPVP